MDTTLGKVLISGGSGFLGVNLAQALGELKYEAVILSRSPPRRQGPWRWVAWDGHTLGAWVDELNGAQAIVNLAGRSVDCRKTPANCDEILRSRVTSTRLLGRAVRQVATPPPVWVQMSSAHGYGDPAEFVCTEDATFGYGLAPFVVRAWEDAFGEAVLPNMRSVVLRTSFVLGRHGGALQRLGWLTRWGLGGTIGHGRQGMSWLHEADMNRILLRAIADDTMSGVYIATAPMPVSNAEFMRALRRALRVPIGLPAAAWMIHLGAYWVLNTDPELALYGRYCVPERLLNEGFAFEHATLDSALQAIYQPRS